MFVGGLKLVKQGDWLSGRTPLKMAVTLARRPSTDPALGRRARVQPMEKFVIEGGVPLSGTMVPAGNKNGALPILASAILTEDEVVVRNVPRIRDVEAMLSILEAIGVRVAWRGPQRGLRCVPSAVHEVEIEPELAELIRASFLLAGPLLARFRPRGDAAAGRRCDRHAAAWTRIWTRFARWAPRPSARARSC